ncbi:MAG: hypothetical protein KDA71_20000 [Planctomycetales bacterium]|nr:hypothetical protein [Planctomycetales bacterium]
MTMTEESYRQLTTRSGFVECDTRTRLIIRGRDRLALLHNLCTNEVKKRQAGDVFETFFCDARGKTIGFASLMLFQDSVILDSAPGQTERLMTHLDRYIIREDVQLADMTAEYDQWLIAGPESPQVIERMIGRAPESLAGEPTELAGQFLMIAPTHFLQDGGFWLFAARDTDEFIANSLTAAGALAIDANAIEVRRVETGTPEFGRDITSENLPQEVGRDKQAISFVKGCYLGQETVARIDALGHVNRLLCGVKLAGETVAEPGTKLVYGDKEVGQITSSVFSPAIGAPLSLAYLRREHATVGMLLTADGESAEVVKLPV